MKKYLYEDLYQLEDKHWWHISKRRAIRKLIKKYNTKENPKILDIGCGTGKNMEELQRLGTVYGLDHSSEALKFCRKRGLKLLTKGTAEKTNLEPNSFDIITILDVLEHTDDKKTLIEMGGILKKDGIIILTVPAYPWLWSKWDEILHHKKRYTINTLKEILVANNFNPIKITYLYSFLILPLLIIRKIKQNISKDFYQSDFKLSNPLFNSLLNNLSKFEFLLAENFYIPFGTSILVVAKNNG